MTLEQKQHTLLFFLFILSYFQVKQEKKSSKKEVLSLSDPTGYLPDLAQVTRDVKTKAKMRAQIPKAPSGV